MRESGAVRDEQSPVIQHLVVMGVSGSGKTTLAQVLAERLAWPYAEADDFHPQANVDKMTAGTPLTDADRLPWLETMRDWLSAETRAGRSAIITCSALKVAYRDLLREAEGHVQFVHLTAPAQLLANRLTQRVGHFMPAALLPSQLSSLEPLQPHEDGLTIVVDVPPGAVADRTIKALGLRPSTGRDG